jgi:hypothetical protein
MKKILTVCVLFVLLVTLPLTYQGLASVKTPLFSKEIDYDSFLDLMNADDFNADIYLVGDINFAPKLKNNENETIYMDAENIEKIEFTKINRLPRRSSDELKMIIMDQSYLQNIPLDDGMTKTLIDIMKKGYIIYFYADDLKVINGLANKLIGNHIEDSSIDCDDAMKPYACYFSLDANNEYVPGILYSDGGLEKGSLDMRIAYKAWVCRNMRNSYQNDQDTRVLLLDKFIDRAKADYGFTIGSAWTKIAGWWDLDYYSQWGIVSVWKSFWYLMDYGDDFYAASARITCDPYNTCNTSWMRCSHDIDYYDEDANLFDYEPKNTPSSTPLSVSFGVIGGQNGINGSIGFSFGFTLNDLEIVNYSSPSTEYADVLFDLNDISSYSYQTEEFNFCSIAKDEDNDGVFKYHNRIRARFFCWPGYSTVDANKYTTCYRP